MGRLFTPFTSVFGNTSFVIVSFFWVAYSYREVEKLSGICYYRPDNHLPIRTLIPIDLLGPCYRAGPCYQSKSMDGHVLSYLPIGTLLLGGTLLPEQVN